MFVVVDAHFVFDLLILLNEFQFLVLAVKVHEVLLWFRQTILSVRQTFVKLLNFIVKFDENLVDPYERVRVVFLVIAPNLFEKLLHLNHIILNVVKYGYIQLTFREWVIVLKHFLNFDVVQVHESVILVLHLEPLFVQI